MSCCFRRSPGSPRPSPSCSSEQPAPPSSCSVERSPVRTRTRPGELLCTTGRVAHGFSEVELGSETVARATVSVKLHTR